MTPTLLYTLIVACEAAFWLVLGGALLVRYVLRNDRASTLLLRCVPLVDVLLLVFTALDLKAGTTATFAHGLAAAYVGFTLAFGGVTVRWADGWFAYWFAGAPSPALARVQGWQLVRMDIVLWLRSIVAWAIALALLVALIAFVDDAAATAPLQDWFRYAFGGVIFWFVFGPLWSLVLALFQRVVRRRA